LECIFECDIDKTAEWLLLISFCPTIRSVEELSSRKGNSPTWILSFSVKYI
jgi:hypothetical protein